MDEHISETTSPTTPEQPVITPVAAPPVEAPKPPRASKALIAGITIALIILVAGVAIAMQVSQQNQVATTPTPTPIAPTPTPIRVLSKFATESAFVSFEESVASLSAVIAGYPITDPSLSPPTLVLPLQF